MGENVGQHRVWTALFPYCNSIPSNFDWITFDQIFSQPPKSGVYVPSKMRGDGFPMVNTGDLFKEDIITNNEHMIRVPLTSQEQEKYLLEPYDLLFARQSLIYEGTGKCSMYLGEKHTTTYDGSIIRVRIDPLKGNPIFYLHFFNSNYGKQVLRTIIHQVAAASIRLTELARIAVPSPPYKLQNRIGRQLFSIREIERSLTEINEKAIQYLDLIFISIFNHHHFDNPIIQSILSNNSPKLTNLGIPVGWNFFKLSEICQLVRKSVNPQKFPEIYWDHHSIPAFKNNKKSSVEIGSSIKSNKYLIPINSVLVSKLNPRFPRIWMPNNIDEEISICSTEFLPFVPTSVSREFLYDLFRSEKFTTDLQSRVTGTTGSHQRVRPEDVEKIEVLLPTTEILKAYSDFSKTYHLLIENNRAKLFEFEKLRETLIPMLISGEYVFN